MRDQRCSSPISRHSFARGVCSVIVWQRNANVVYAVRVLCLSGNAIITLLMLFKFLVWLSVLYWRCSSQQCTDTKFCSLQQWQRINYQQVLFAHIRHLYSFVMCSISRFRNFGVEQPIECNILKCKMRSYVEVTLSHELHVTACMHTLRRFNQK